MLTFNYALLCLVAVHMSIYAWLNDDPFLFHLYIPHILLFLTSYERQKKKKEKKEEGLMGFGRTTQPNRENVGHQHILVLLCAGFIGTSCSYMGKDALIIFE